MALTPQLALVRARVRPQDNERADTTRMERLGGIHVTELLEAGHIHCAFQPIVDLQTGDTFAFEVLLRSSHDVLNTPRLVLDTAHEQGKIGLVSRYVRQLAIERCSGHRLFFNVHPAEFDEEWLVQPDEPMCAHLDEVYLEIPESVPLTRYRFCPSILRELRSRGIKLAIDDFGAGYANLKYITDFRPEIVKLDREVIVGLRSDSPEQVLVRSLVELCRAQGARVIVEGIETASELHAVRGAGVPYAQGFFLAVPGPVARVANYTSLWT